jgi:C-terminal processing protease CtpA/Prc
MTNGHKLAIVLVGSKIIEFGRVGSLMDVNSSYFKLKLTTGYLLSPNGKSIEKNGVRPDSAIEGQMDQNKSLFPEYYN